MNWICVFILNLYFFINCYWFWKSKLLHQEDQIYIVSITPRILFPLSFLICHRRCSPACIHPEWALSTQVLAHFKCVCVCVQSVASCKSGHNELSFSTHNKNTNFRKIVSTVYGQCSYLLLCSGDLGKIYMHIFTIVGFCCSWPKIICCSTGGHHVAVSSSGHLG